MAKATKLPSGSWRCKAYYTDEYGKYKSKSFTAETKKEAEYMAREYLMEREHAAKPENRTLGEAADIFLEAHPFLSPSTVRGYKSIRKNAFQTIINVPLGKITKELYQEAVNAYAKGGDRGRSPKTVLSAHTFYKKVLNENGITVADHATLPQRTKKEIQIPTTQEVRKFLDEIRVPHKRLYLYCLFSICLGLRKSETIALQWSDVDLEKKTVTINKAKVRDEYNTYVEKTTKTFSGTRTLHLPPMLIEALEAEEDKEGDIFKSSPKAMESLYQRQCARLGFPYNFHALRHYYASVMLVSGMPNKYAQERMGHATQDMLIRVYQHVFATEQERYNALLDDFFEQNFREQKEGKVDPAS